MDYRCLLSAFFGLTLASWAAAGDKPPLEFATPEANAKIVLPAGTDFVKIKATGTHTIRPTPGQEFRLVLHDIYSNVYRQSGYVQMDSDGTWLHGNVNIGREISRVEVFCLNPTGAIVFDSWEFGAKSAKQLQGLGGYQKLGSRNISVVEE